jgi:hypothetical protein
MFNPAKSNSLPYVALITIFLMFILNLRYFILGISDSAKLILDFVDSVQITKRLPMKVLFEHVITNYTTNETCLKIHLLSMGIAWFLCPFQIWS